MAKKCNKKKLRSPSPALDMELVALYAKREWEKGRAERESKLEFYFDEGPYRNFDAQRRRFKEVIEICCLLFEQRLETLYQLCVKAWEKQSTVKTSGFFDDALLNVIRPEIERWPEFVRRVIDEVCLVKGSTAIGSVVRNSTGFESKLLDKWNLQIEIEKREYAIESTALQKGQSEGGYPTPPQKRAADVAKIIKELDILKPNMLGARSDYEKLRDSYREFLTFEIASKHPELEVKVLNLQGHRRHIRLAQELTAAYHGRALETVQNDWKKYKPPEYRTKKS